MTLGDGSLVGAGALVAEGTVVPPDHRALGVPARIRPGAGTAGFVSSAVELCVATPAGTATGSPGSAEHGTARTRLRRASTCSVRASAGGSACRAGQAGSRPA
jgi:hypothetical protein